MNHRRQSGRRLVTLGLVVGGVLSLAAAACSSNPTPSNSPARILAVGNLSAPIEGCKISTPLPDAGVDAAPSPDAGTPADTGAVTDTGVDAAGDAGAPSDAGLDAAADVGTDTGAVADAGSDTGLDAAMDVGTDAAIDAGMDAGADTSADVGAQADTSVEPDAGADTGLDAATPQPTSATTLERVGDALSVPYLISDLEGDDQRVDVQICEWDGQQATNCGTAVQAPGGDGTDFVPTTPAGTCVLHVFYWDVGCGRFVQASNNGQAPQSTNVDSVDQQWVVRVSVVGSKEAPGQSEPFTLKDVGFDVVPACQ